MSQRPNILLLMTDQQRYDSLGCYGCPCARTPNLDRLAAEGALFEQDYVNNPLCTPSRASMFTGKHLPGHGVYRLYDNLPESEVLFTKHLQALDYTTALFGKLHVSSRDYEHYQRHPHDGFDIFELCMEPCLLMDAPYQAYSQWLETNHPEFRTRMMKEGRNVLHHPQEKHMTHWAAERTIDFLKHHDRTKPFFAMMSIFDPHNPYEDYPQEMAERIDPARIPDPVVRQDNFEGLPPAILREHHGCGLGDFDRFTRQDLDKIRFGYHASIAFADQEFGRVLAVLEAQGLADNTLVVFTSDHGDMLGDHGLLVKGAFFYDANTRVPLILRWPERFSGGRRSPALVQNHDLAATILAAAGMDREAVSSVMPDARDLTPLAAGEASEVHEEVVCCYRNSGLSGEPTRTPYWDPPIHATMLRAGRYKLNLWHAREEPAGELYDMENDPGEQQNLWADPAHTAARLELTERLLQWLAAQEIRSGSRGGETRPQVMLKNALQ